MPHKYTCVQTRTLLQIRVNYSNSILTHMTFHQGAYIYHFGLEQLKDKTVKSSAIFLAL